MCCQKDMPPNAENKRVVAENLIPIIRFPLMKVQDFTENVVTKNKGFLTEEETHMLYIYMTAGESTK